MFKQLNYMEQNLILFLYTIIQRCSCFQLLTLRQIIRLDEIIKSCRDRNSSRVSTDIQPRYWRTAIPRTKEWLTHIVAATQGRQQGTTDDEYIKLLGMYVCMYVESSDRTSVSPHRYVHLSEALILARHCTLGRPACEQTRGLMINAMKSYGGELPTPVELLQKYN